MTFGDATEDLISDRSEQSGWPITIVSHTTIQSLRGEYQMDTTSENIKRLNLELKNEERHLREDLTEIKSKIQAARAELSPSKLIEQRLLPISGLALAVGFALGSRGHSVKGF